MTQRDMREFGFRKVPSRDRKTERWMKNFSTNLREMMDDRGMDQKTLSGMSGVPMSSISEYLNRKAIPSALIVCKMATAMDCSSSDLID